MIRGAIFLFFIFSSYPAFSSSENPTAHKAKVKYENLVFDNINEWSSKDEMLERFSELRDKKFLSYKERERRIPWLYVRDGCHTRSTLFINEAERMGYKKPSKVFIFGPELEIKSPFQPNGSIKPWFHAAPIIKVDGKPMVLDPAVSYSKPIPLRTWAELITKDFSKTAFSICAPDTYQQTSSCFDPVKIDKEKLETDTHYYLRFEWNMMKHVGLLPDSTVL